METAGNMEVVEEMVWIQGKKAAVGCLIQTLCEGLQSPVGVLLLRKVLPLGSWRKVPIPVLTVTWFGEIELFCNMSECTGPI